jgi:hypothetical protein
MESPEAPFRAHVIARHNCGMGFRAIANQANGNCADFGGRCQA